jgi:hypothetical protein
MLTKNARQALADSKPKGRMPALPSATPAAVINEPKADWVPLRWAPFYCTSNGFILSPAKWGEALCDELQRLSQKAKCSFESDKFSFRIRVHGIETHIEPGVCIWVSLPDDDFRGAHGDSDVSMPKSTVCPQECANFFRHAGYVST